MGGGAEILKLLAREDVQGNEMDLSVTVLAGLGGGHVDDLARAALDHDKAVLPQSRALHGVGEGGASVGVALVLKVMVLWHAESAIILFSSIVFGALEEAYWRYRGAAMQLPRQGRRGTVVSRCGVMTSSPTYCQHTSAPKCHKENHFN